MFTGTIVLIILSLLPIVILLWYFDHLDQVKEKRTFLWSIFLWGILITFIAGGIEVFLDNYLLGVFYSPVIQLIVSAFIFTAVTEEVLKYWVVKRKTYNHPAFNEYYDGIVYGVVASLGFAALENIFYVLSGGFFVAVIRAILAVPAHALFGAIMGYYIGLAKFEKNREKEKKLLSKGLILAVLLHGVYDFLLMTETVYALLVIPLIIAMYINVKRKIRHLHFLDKIEGAFMPVKWKLKNYLRVIFGLLFFTVGVLALFTAAFYFSGDPSANEVFKDIEFNALGTLIFAFIMWAFSFVLIRKT